MTSTSPFAQPVRDFLAFLRIEAGLAPATLEAYGRDLRDLVAPKIMHDITGHYNQFGVLSLHLNRTPQRPLVEEAHPQTLAQLP